MRRTPLMNYMLFALTCLTTMAGGAYQMGVDPLAEPSRIVAGLPYSAAILSILLVHEFGHYFAARAHRVDATLPFFIPLPPLPFVYGTLGAVIKMRSPIMDRRSLMDIGAYGPIAGFVVAVVVSAIGLGMSEIQTIGPGDASSIFGDSIAFAALSGLMLGPVPEGSAVFLHPVAFAGWLGMFVTMVNLMPMGQLDGGHVWYSLAGEKAHMRTGQVLTLVLAPVGLMGLLAVFNVPGVPPWLAGYCWPGWFVWAVLFRVLGLKHPAVYNREPRLDSRRKVLAVLSGIIFILTFMPVPIVVS